MSIYSKAIEIIANFSFSFHTFFSNGRIYFYIFLWHKGWKWIFLHHQFQWRSSSSSIFTFEEKFYSKQLAANPIETFTNEHRDSNELVGRFFWIYQIVKNINNEVKTTQLLILVFQFIINWRKYFKEITCLKTHKNCGN